MQYGDSFLIERKKFLCPRPISFVGDNTVCEIAARIKNRESCFDSGSVHLHIGTTHEALKSVCNIGDRPLIASPEHPYELTEYRQWYNDKRCFLQSFCGLRRLFPIILDGGSHKHVGIDGNFHFPPAQP